MIIWKRALLLSVLAGLIGGLFVGLNNAALAQQITLDMGEGGGSATARVLQLIALITVISVAPSLLIMVTCFTRIIIVLSFVRTAMGTATTPPNQVLMSLALFMTVFLMMPVFEKAWDLGIVPLMNEEIDEFEAFDRASGPFREFMLVFTREKDLELFADLSNVSDEEIREEVPHACSDPRLYDFRDQASVRNWLFDLYPLLGHRHGRRLGIDGYGHDDAATGDYLASVQDHLFCAGGWLVHGGRKLSQRLWRALTHLLTRFPQSSSASGAWQICVDKTTGFRIIC